VHDSLRCSSLCNFANVTSCARSELTNSHPLSTATFSITIRIDWFFGRTWRTDTQPNPTEFDCRDHARRGISTSTYGLGHHFNDDLMLAMAKVGRGNAYYGQTAADLAEPFQAELALLTNLCTHGVVLTVTAPANVNVELRNDCEPLEGEPHAWKWPDVWFGAEAWALLQFTIPVARLVAGSTPDLPIAIAVRAGGAVARRSSSWRRCPRCQSSPQTPGPRYRPICWSRGGPWRSRPARCATACAGHRTRRPKRR
jgi:hypothetical protein